MAGEEGRFQRQQADAIKRLRRELPRVDDGFSQERHAQLFQLGRKIEPDALAHYLSSARADFKAHMPATLDRMLDQTIHGDIEEGIRKGRPEWEHKPLILSYKRMALEALKKVAADYHGRPLADAAKRLGELGGEMELQLKRLKHVKPGDEYDRALNGHIKTMYYAYMLDAIAKRTMIGHWARANGREPSESLAVNVANSHTFMTDPAGFIAHIPIKATELELREAAEREQEREDLEAKVAAIRQYVEQNYSLESGEVESILGRARSQLLRGRDPMDAVNAEALRLHNRKLKTLSQLPQYARLRLWDRVNAIGNEKDRKMIVYGLVSRILRGAPIEEIHALLPQNNKAKQARQAALPAQPEPAQPKREFAEITGRFKLREEESKAVANALRGIHKRMRERFDREFMPAFEARVSGGEGAEQLRGIIEETRREFYPREEQEEEAQEEKAPRPQVPNGPPRERTIREVLREIEEAEVVDPQSIVELKRLAVQPEVKKGQRLAAAEHIILYGHAAGGFQQKLPGKEAFAKYLPRPLHGLTINAVDSLIDREMLRMRYNVKRASKGNPRKGNGLVIATQELMQKYRGVKRNNG